MKITKRQLKRIIKEEKAVLEQSWRQNPAKIRRERRQRDRQRMIDTMTFKQLKRRAFDSALFIQGRLDTGQYEYADIWEAEIPGLADLIDAAKVKAAEEGVTYDDIPEVRHNGAIVDLSRYSLGLPTTIKENKVKITKRQLRKIIKEEKAKVLAENRVRKAVRKALLKENKIDGGYPEEFGGTAGYKWVPPREVSVGDYVEVTTHSGQVVRGIALKHGDDPQGGPYTSSAEKTWDGRVKAVYGQIHMRTEPDAKGRGGNRDEFVDFRIPRNSRMVLKLANPGYQQQSLGL